MSLLRSGKDAVPGPLPSSSWARCSPSAVAAHTGSR